MSRKRGGMILSSNVSICFFEIFIHLKEMNFETTEKYCEIFNRQFEVYPMFERELDDGDMSNEFGDFLAEHLGDCYPTLYELKDDIHHIDIPKKKFTFTIHI